MSLAERQKQLDRQRIGTKGVVDIFLREVKFNDQEKISESESIPQRCVHRSRTKVGGSKTIRYRRSLNHKRCRLGIGCRYKPVCVDVLFFKGVLTWTGGNRKEACGMYCAVCGQNRLFQDFARNQEVDGLRGEYGRKAET